MQKWTPKYQFPTDNYVIRVTDEKFGPSNSSGNPMITLEFEVDRPEEVEIGGEQFNVAGVKVQPAYYTTRNPNDSEKEANAQKRVNELYSLFGLDNSVIDFDNPSLGFKGKLVHARLYSEERVQRKTPTAAQIAEAKKTGKQPEGDVLKHPITGIPQVSYFPKIGEIFGLANAEANKPF